MSKRCQIVKKMSNCQKDVKCQKIKHIDYGGGSQKKLIDIMRFTHFDINFWCRICWSLKTLKMCIESVLNNFGDLHIWRQNWRQYVWTSLCQLFFLWTSSLVYVFDFLTSFWQLDIFLTIWHLFDTWAMQHMANGAHGQWGHMGKWYIG